MLSCLFKKKWNLDPCPCLYFPLKLTREQNLKSNKEHTEQSTFTKVKKSLRFKTREITIDTNE